VTQNLLFFAIGANLAASWFLVPQLLGSQNHYMRVAATTSFYLSVCGGIFVFANTKSALAALELGLLFTVLIKLILLNLKMVHTANYPKHRRCY